MIKSGIFWFFLWAPITFGGEEVDLRVGGFSFVYDPSGNQLEFKLLDEGIRSPKISISLKDLIPRHHNRYQMSQPIVSDDADKIAVWFTSYLEGERDPYKFGFVSAAQVPSEESSLFVFDRFGAMIGQYRELGVEGSLSHLKFLGGHCVELHPFDQKPIVIDL